MKRTVLILLAFVSVLCMGALTKPTPKMVALPHWRVDATIAGDNPSLGVSAVTSYTGIENANLTLTNASGNGVVTAQIPCSSTNSPSGTTCSAGSESVGVSFTIPSDGCATSGACDVKACASFTWQPVVDSSSDSLAATFQIVETPANAQTISQEGKSRIPGIFTGSAAVSTAVGFPFRVCGTFTFNSAGQKTFRLMYEQSINSTPTNSNLLADGNTSNGQRDIHWEVYPILSY
jgi:hypothetical protein